MSYPERCTVVINDKRVPYCKNKDIRRVSKWPSGTRFYCCDRCACAWGVDENDERSIVYANGQEVGRTSKITAKSVNRIRKDA